MNSTFIAGIKPSIAKWYSISLGKLKILFLNS